jgi:hypothetical protein
MSITFMHNFHDYRVIADAWADRQGAVTKTSKILAVVVNLVRRIILDTAIIRGLLLLVLLLVLRQQFL